MTDDLPAQVTVEQLTLTTTDGVALRAEVAAPSPARTAMIVCHPHPLYGGSMRANVVEALFRSLPGQGVAVLRFDFRGAGGSGGAHDNGRGEQLDILAAIEWACDQWPGTPLTLAGYSFGADIALAVDHEQVVGWFAVAPPLRILDVSDLVALDDPRPKHLVVAAHDQVRPPTELAELVTGCPNTTITTVDGADHFFAVGLPTIVAAAVEALSP